MVKDNGDAIQRLSRVIECLEYYLKHSKTNDFRNNIAIQETVLSEQINKLYQVKNFLDV